MTYAQQFIMGRRVFKEALKRAWSEKYLWWYIALYVAIVMLPMAMLIVFKPHVIVLMQSYGPSVWVYSAGTFLIAYMIFAALMARLIVRNISFMGSFAYITQVWPQLVVMSLSYSVVSSMVVLMFRHVSFVGLPTFWYRLFLTTLCSIAFLFSILIFWGIYYFLPVLIHKRQSVVSTFKHAFGFVFRHPVTAWVIFLLWFILVIVVIVILGVTYFAGLMFMSYFLLTTVVGVACVFLAQMIMIAAFVYAIMYLLVVWLLMPGILYLHVQKLDKRS
jgi:hypothetical protein